MEIANPSGSCSGVRKGKQVSVELRRTPGSTKLQLVLALQRQARSWASGPTACTELQLAVG